MGTLTDSTPKPMLMVAGKTLLEHKFDILPREVEEILIIVGYQAETMTARYGSTYKGMPIRYVKQTELNGSMGALALAAPYLTERFVVMMGDDIYSQDDLVRTIAAGEWAMLVEETERMAAGGCVVVDESGKVTDIIEGDHSGKRGIMNTNMFALDTRVFGYPMVPKAVGSDEYGLPQTVLAASRTSGITLHAVRASNWIQITAPEDLIESEARLAIEDRR